MKKIYLFTIALLIASISFFVQNAAAQSTTFNYTGGEQTYTVPTGVTTLGVDAMGGGGGYPYWQCGNTQQAYAPGGRVQCVLAVTPGSVLYIYVGGQGGSETCSSCTAQPGGFNGGVAGGSCAGGSGGATDIRTTATTGISGTNVLPYTSTNRLVVAGGGGGGADYYGNGGYGGGLTGGTGFVNATYGGTGGNGGTQTGPGAGVGAATSAPYLGTLGIGGSRYTYSGGGGGYWGGNSGVGTAGGAGGGSSYTDPTLCTSVAHTQGYSGATGNGRVVLTVLCNGPGTILGTASVCVGASTTLSNPTTASGGTWVSANTAVATINSSTGVVTGVAAGQANITYQVPNPCGSFAVRTVTVNPLPTAIIGSNNVCIGSSLTLSSASTGGTWVSSSTSQASVGSSSGVVTGVASGFPTLTYTLPTTCSITFPMTVNASPSAISGIASVCPGNTTTLSNLTTGGTWSSSNTSLATVGSSTGVVTGVASGFPTITYTALTGCIATTVVNVLGMNPIVGSLGTCTLGTTTTLTDASPGGTWTSSNPATATIGSLSGVVTSVAYGITTISYTLASSGCVATAVYGVNPTSGGTFSMTGGGSYCAGGTGVAVGLSGSTFGVSYQLFNGSGPVGSPISGAGFSMSFGLQTAGTYFVIANQGTSCALTMSGSSVVNANPLPTPFTVSGGGSYCAGGSGVHIFLNSSTIGINYQLMLGTTPVGSPISGTSASLDFGFVTAVGTYSVVGTNATTGCVGSMANTVTVSTNPLPSTFNVTVTGSGGYCTGGTGVSIGLNGSVAGNSYTLYYGGVSTGLSVTGTGIAFNFTPAQTAAGVYTVVATNTVTTCATNMTGSATVTVNPLPTVFTVTGGGSYCLGGTGLPIGLNGSTFGVNYQLYNGTATVGSLIAGTGASISFGTFTAAGSYTVVATAGASGCVNNMFGSAAIVINPLPTLFSVTGGGQFCAGGSGVPVGLSGSVAGINYSLYNGGTLVSAASGTGAAINFGLQTSAGTYSVVATNTATSCINNMSGSAVVVVNSLPPVFTVTGGGAYCSGGSGTIIGLSSSTSGVNYQLLLAGAPSGSVVAGTGSAISFGTRTAAGSYTVVATNATTTCSNIMLGSVSITINPTPTTYNVTGGAPYCTGGAGSVVGLSASNTGINYQLFNGAGAIGSPVSGLGAAITYGLQTIPGTYTVQAINTVTGCTSIMLGSPVISLLPLPNAYTVTGAAPSYCAGGSGVDVTISNSTTGVNYQLLNGTALVGSPVAGNGFPLDFGFQTAAGTYFVLATNATTTCVNNMLGSAVITINPLPTAYPVTGGGSYCATGAGVHVGVLASTTGTNYQLYNGAATVGAPIGGTGAALDFGSFTAAGSYSVRATNTSTGCLNLMTGAVTIAINPLPALHTLTGGGNYCAGSTGSVIGVNTTETGINYQLLLTGGPVGAPLGGTGSSISFGSQTATGTYTIMATDAVTGCSVNMIGSSSVNVNPLPSLHSVTGGGNYCPGGTGVSVGLGISDPGISYQLYNGASTVGTPLAGTGLVLNFGLQTATGTYTIKATNSTTSCTNVMTGNAIVGIASSPVVYNMTGGGNYCPAGSGVHVGLSGSNLGVSYQLFRGGLVTGITIAGTGLPLDFGLQTASGLYTVVASNPGTGCSSNMNGSVSVGVSLLPTLHTVTGGGNYCPGSAGVTVGLDGSDAGTSYQLFNGGLLAGTAVAGTGSAIDFGMHTSGTYTVVAQGAGTTCVSNMTGSVIVDLNPLPLAYNVAGGGNYCSGGTGVHITLSGSLVGTDYQLFMGGSPVGAVVNGTGSPIDFGTFTAAGTYSAVATDASTGCTNNMTGTVNIGINALPIAYSLTGGDNYCSGGTGVHVVLSGSNTGISYQLVNSGLPVGSAMPGTGLSIDFGLMTASGTYTVVATNNTTSCTNNMTGSVNVGINPLPNVYAVTSTSSNYCIGGAGVSISLTGSNTGVNYQLYRGISPVGTPVAGTGGVIGFGFNTLAGVYTVIATNTATGCIRTMASSVTVVIDPLPVAFTITGGGNYCAGGSGVTVGLSGSTAGTLYQLYNGALPVGTPVAGTGSAISFGAQTGSGTYRVVATNPATTCTNNMSGSVNVGMNTLPTPFTVSGGGNFCAGGSGVVVSLSSSTTGVTYQLMNGTTPVGSPIAGNGSPLSFGAVTTGGTYTVVGTNTATSCSNNMSGSAVVAVTPLPGSFTVTGGGNFCSGGTGVHVSLSGSTYGISYQLFNGSTPVGSVVTGFGTAIDFGLQTGVGSYTVVATDLFSGCSRGMSGTINVGINPLPAVYNVTGGGNYCATGSGVHINLNGSTLGVNYQLYNGLLPVGTAVPGNGSILDLGLQTAAGSYTVVATNATTGCTRTMAGAATISITPSVTPGVSISTISGDTLCSGNFTTFNATVINGGTSPTYHWTINGTAITAASGSYAYIPVNGDVLAVTITSTAACATTPTATGSLTMNVLDQGTPSVTVAANPGNVVCTGTSVLFTATPAFGGTTPSYSWFKGTANVGSGSTLTYTPANGDNVYCVLTSNYHCRLANTATSTHITMQVDNVQTPVVTIAVNPTGNITVGQNVVFTATATNAGTAPTYQWTVNGTVVPGANANIFASNNLNNNDEVCCQVFSSGGCAGTMGSACKTVHFAGVGVQPIVSTGSDFMVVPNPNKGTFTVKGNFGTLTNEEVTVEVTNTIGQIVYSSKVMSQNGEINEKVQLSNNLANGMYILNLRSGSDNKVFHLVIEQ